MAAGYCLLKTLNYLLGIERTIMKNVTIVSAFLVVVSVTVSQYAEEAMRETF